MITSTSTNSLNDRHQSRLSKLSLSGLTEKATKVIKNLLKEDDVNLPLILGRSDSTRIRFTKLQEEYEIQSNLKETCHRYPDGGWSFGPLTKGDHDEFLKSYNENIWGKKIASCIHHWEGSSDILHEGRGTAKRYAYDLGNQLALLPLIPSLGPKSETETETVTQDKSWLEKQNELISTALSFSTHHPREWEEIWKVDKEHCQLKIHDRFTACTNTLDSTTTNQSQSHLAHFKSRISRILDSDKKSHTAGHQGLISTNTSDDNHDDDDDDDDDQSSSIYNFERDNSIGSSNGKEITASYSLPLEYSLIRV